MDQDRCAKTLRGPYCTLLFVLLQQRTVCCPLFVRQKYANVECLCCSNILFNSLECKIGKYLTVEILAATERWALGGHFLAIKS